MKHILFLLLVLLISFSLHAQKFKAGVLAGLTTTQVDGDTYAGYNKIGMRVGGFVSRKFAPNSKWSASFEITYIQKGSRKIPHPDKGDYAAYKLNLNYVEVPLLIKYDLVLFSDSTSAKQKHFLIFGGVGMAKLVHSYEEDKFGKITGGTPFQKSDISYIFGINYFVSTHICLDARSEYSMLPVRKGGTSTYYQNWTFKYIKPGYYNNLLIFSIFYRF